MPTAPGSPFDGSPSRGHRSRCLRLLAPLLALALIGGGAAPALAAAPTSSAAPALTAKAAPERRLQARLRALLEELPGRYTVQVRELDGDRRTAGVGATTEREPASTSKIFIAYGVFSRLDAGTLRYTDRLPSGLTVRQCIEAMIEPSDNYCAVDLRNLVGTAALNRLLERGGFDDTHFWYDGARTKVTSAADTNRLLARLARGTLLSEPSSAEFLRLLKTHVWREAIPPGLPDGVVQASKPGTLWTGSGMVQTDVAVVWGERSRYVLSVFGSNDATIHAITRISRLVYRELQGPIGRPFVYDREQMKATGTLVLREGSSGASAELGRYPAGTKVEVIDSVRNRYQVRIAGRVGWITNTHLTLRHPIL